MAQYRKKTKAAKTKKRDVIVTDEQYRAFKKEMDEYNSKSNSKGSKKKKLPFAKIILIGREHY